MRDVALLECCTYGVSDIWGVELMGGRTYGVPDLRGVAIWGVAQMGRCTNGLVGCRTCEVSDLDEVVAIEGCLT